ncbi:MAG: Tetratricopeptide repeat [Gemmatimonadaceae bacterium]|nr:Tetratricopeptide repeat [Gemmatimonadaceae bacterium]
MRTRSTRIIAAVAILFVPLAAQSQDASLKLSTTSPAAVTEFRAGMTDYQNLAVESAASHFKAAIDADPNFGLARVLYASTAPLDPSAQSTELNRGVADAAKVGGNELVLAAAYHEAALNHNDAASALYRAASQLMPADPLLAAGAAGGFGAPLATTRELVTKFPSYAPGYNTLAYQSWNAGDRAAALAAAKRQVELLPTAPNPHDSYAELLQWNGNLAEAAAHYKEATTLSPKFPEAYAGLAEVAALQGQYDQARGYLNQAIANSWSPQQKLGYMRQIFGVSVLQGAPVSTITQQLEAAIAEAKAQNDARTTAVLYSQLATVQANAGNATAAHQSLAMAKAASPTIPPNVHYYGAMAHGLMKHWSPAAEELAAMKAQAAAEPGTVSPVALAALEGYQLTQQGKAAAALPILMAADTTNVLVANRIAEAHAALGHTAEAAAWNKRVSANYALNLTDFTNVNSRRRARLATASR